MRWTFTIRVCALFAALWLPGCSSSTKVANTEGSRSNPYDPHLDYFPEKVAIRYARGLRVEYSRHYKIVTIDPGGEGNRVQRFALVQRGAPPPEGWEASRIIEVPVRRYLHLGQVWESLIDDLDLEDRLVGVYSFDASTSPSIRRMIEDKKLVATGAHHFTNQEAVATAQPEVVGRTFTDPDPAEPLLQSIGVKSIPFAYGLEQSILARSEWMKLIGVLFNREKDVSLMFDRIAAEYETLSTRARAAAERPIVLYGYPDRDRWVVNWDAAQQVQDAGGGDFSGGAARPSAGASARLPVESVIARASGAPKWVYLPEYVGTLEALIRAEKRIGAFQAVRSQEVYDLCARCESPTRNAFWTEFLSRPNDVLKDLVSVIHPELVPEHRLIYFRRAPWNAR